MASIGAQSMPKRLRFKLVSNGERIKIFFDEDMGGSYLVYSKVVEDVLHRGKSEGYADFVKDKDGWKESNK